MVNVDIDEDLYEDIKALIKKFKYDYPSIKFFVQKAIYNELINSKNAGSAEIFNFYSKLKEIINHNPELQSKVDEMYSSEVRKLRKGVLR